MRNSSRKFLGGSIAVAMLGAAAAMVTAVAQADASGVERASATMHAEAVNRPTVRAHARWETSRAWIPSSIGELNRASARAVIAIVAEDSSREMVNGIPFTIHTVKVEKTLKGAPATTLKVRELGDGLEPTSLQPGTKHVLFLSPFEMTRGESTGQFVVTAQLSGDYLIDSSVSKSPSLAQAVRVDPDAPELPVRVSVSELAAAAGPVS